jgi:hypothetical protein
MSDWKTVHLTVIAKMVREPVVGTHHKQKDTIKGWCGGFDGDVVDAAIDDLLTDPTAPLREKGRGTIQLTSVADAKAFLEEHDDDDEFVWFT